MSILNLNYHTLIPLLPSNALGSRLAHVYKRLQNPVDRCTSNFIIELIRIRKQELSAPLDLNEINALLYNICTDWL